MGPANSGAGSWQPLADSVGAIGDNPSAAASEQKFGDLFFPKPFNDEQIAIIRRLEDSDGVVVQGPPGTGKTHTISNIICHAMATGQRVLVVSHAEPALAVLRDQLPESVRPLAISITTSEREGFRQLESAVRELQSIVENIRGPDQLRSIRDTEAVITGLRDQLAATDREIEEFAHRQLAPAFGGKRAADLAETVVAAADCHEWFSDRPTIASAEAAPTDQQMNALREARAHLGARLEYLGVSLPSLDDLPDGDTIAKWHDDLQRAKAYGEAAKQAPSIQIRLDSIEAADAAITTADAIRDLRAMQAAAQSRSWFSALANRAVNQAAKDGVFDLVRSFADEARPVAKERQRYLATPVELPESFEAAGPEAVALIAKLAAGGKAYGVLAFKERGLRPLIDAIRVQGQAPAGAADYALVRDYIAWREQISRLSFRWRALAEELDAPSFATGRELAELIGDLDTALIETPQAIDKISKGLQTVIPRGLSPQALWFEASRLEAVEQALRNAAASAKLAAVQVEVTRLSLLFRDGTKAIGAAAREFLKGAIGSEGVAPEKAGEIWNDLRAQIADIRHHAADFHLVSQVSDAIRHAGAPTWAHQLQIDPAADGVDTLIPGDWRDAWDWAVASAYLMRIDDKQRLRHLAEERVRLDASLRKKFEQLVRERTYYELGRSMTGPIKAALMMFATAVRRAGKGTGKSAGRFRRDAQAAMARCYGAIPCWIMPSWRVAEQLPGEVGTFDLVIMDEASQSDTQGDSCPSTRKKDPRCRRRQAGEPNRGVHRKRQDRPARTQLPAAAALQDTPVAWVVALRPRQGHVSRQTNHAAGALPLREPIIRFSMSFYPEPLVPLRVPTAHERLDPPLVDIYVPDGRRTGDKTNRREAEVIVEEIKRTVEDPAIARIHAADRWRTIGVVSLIGSKQAALVNRLILEELGEDIMLRHRIACGDSATFQGNERDIMFVSMIADPGSKQAQTAMQFEQRFNVAMSRARDRIVLVRSVEEYELNPLDLKARIIRHFRDPMAGAQAPTGDLQAMCNSDFERAILRRLIAEGYRVAPQVGAEGYRIDLVVEGASGRRLAVECDGDKYHGPERWADDMRRQRILERVGWRFWRCWASSFTLDPDGCMADLFDTLNRVGVEPSSAERAATRYTSHVVVEAAKRPGDENLENPSRPRDAIRSGTASSSSIWMTKSKSR